MDVEFRSRGYRLLTAALLLAGSAAAAQAPRSVRLPLERADGPPREARAPALPPLPQITPVIPMVFPIVGEVGWTDTYNPVGGNGYRRHRGQDLMAPRHRPLVAVFDGVVQLHRRGTHYMLILRGDNGFTAWYMHLNNDTPGTDDGQGPPEYAYARGLSTGDRVRAGQLVGWVGDSGNAENTEPHLHFELHGPQGVFNPAPSLQAARRLSAGLPRGGRIALTRRGPIRERRSNSSRRLADAAREPLPVRQPSGRIGVVLVDRERAWPAAPPRAPAAASPAPERADRPAPTRTAAPPAVGLSEKTTPGRRTNPIQIARAAVPQPREMERQPAAVTPPPRLPTGPSTVGPDQPDSRPGRMPVEDPAAAATRSGPEVALRRASAARALWLGSERIEAAARAAESDRSSPRRGVMAPRSRPAAGRAGRVLAALTRDESDRR